MRLSSAFTSLLVLFGATFVLAGGKGHGTPELTEVTRVTLDGVTYINKGIVAFGQIPSDFRESTGDTLGGIGSAIALKPRSWKVEKNGRFIGTLYVHPDRGFNVDSTINYQARHHEIDFVLTPYYGSENLNFTIAQKTLALRYKSTVLEFDVNRKPTSGLDPREVRFPSRFSDRSFPGPLPIVSKVDDRLVLDVEGLIANEDGSFWISDEYGPGIYRFSKKGTLLQSIPLPDALLPRDAAGNLNFTSVVDPAAGRTPNQGFEGLTIDPTTGILYAMLQSAAIQDGGTDKSTSRYSRLFAFNPKGPEPRLVGEWVVPLPLSSKNNTEACSEIHFVRPGVFFALSRDGDGRGGDDNNSKYKNADLFSIRGATNIHGTKFDNHLNPIAVNGVLDPSIKPAEYVQFISYVNDSQLARFGLHNGSPDDPTLLSAKWESFALAPVGDPKSPDDYFLFTAADNDFLSTHGVSLGQPFDAGLDNDNQFLVFRVTLPGSPIRKKFNTGWFGSWW
ncbi:hypothetical protein D9756_002858 [Leucocoprinus leucothites]|uniref:Phytase-like domain-containing protein n=1 Tax=Leucocoprinus leucothites TaxID=201217 RepID=A0A8H5G7P1_9AGAR|nr:hypothetical protein D9756_002858 [Leucoagaricus leucothites]